MRSANQAVGSSVSGTRRSRCWRRWRSICARVVRSTKNSLSTISPSLSQQFSALVNLAVVTNVVPYVLALSALMMMMQKAEVTPFQYRRNVAVALVAMLYSVYAIYASGADAVLGGTVVMGTGFVIFGFLAPRFGLSGTTTAQAAAGRAA